MFTFTESKTVYTTIIYFSNVLECVQKWVRKFNDMSKLQFLENKETLWT